MICRGASVALMLALMVALAAPLLLLARAIDDPLIGTLTLLIALVTAAPFLAHPGARRHSG